MTAQTKYICDLCGRNTVKHEIEVIGVARYYPAGGPTEVLTVYPAVTKSKHICKTCIEDVKNMIVGDRDFTTGETVKE